MSAVSLLIDTMNCKIYLFIHSYINEYHQLAWPPVKSRKHCEGQKYVQSAVAVFNQSQTSDAGREFKASFALTEQEAETQTWLTQSVLCDVCVQPALCLAVDFYPVLGFQRVDSGSR